MTDHSLNAEGVWLQITSGRGPAECQLAVAQLVRRSSSGRPAPRVSPCDVLDAVEGQQRGALALRAHECRRARCPFLRQRPDRQRAVDLPVAGSGRATSARTGSSPSTFLTAPEAGSRQASTARDVAFEAMRASGPGGQHVNKTESAVGRRIGRPASSSRRAKSGRRR